MVPYRLTLNLPIVKRGRFHCSVWCILAILFAHDPLSSSAYPVITHTHPVTRNVSIKDCCYNIGDWKQVNSCKTWLGCMRCMVEYEARSNAPQLTSSNYFVGPWPPFTISLYTTLWSPTPIPQPAHTHVHTHVHAMSYIHTYMSHSRYRNTNHVDEQRSKHNVHYVLQEANEHKHPRETLGLEVLL